MSRSSVLIWDSAFSERVYTHNGICTLVLSDARIRLKSSETLLENIEP